MSTVLTNERLKPKARFDRLSSESEDSQQPFVSPLASTLPVSPQSTIGNASIASSATRADSLEVMSEPSALQSAYGNAALANATPQPYVNAPETAPATPLGTIPESTKEAPPASVYPPSRQENKPAKDEAKVAEPKATPAPEKEAQPVQAAPEPVKMPAPVPEKIVPPKVPEAAEPGAIQEASEAGKPEKTAEKIKTPVAGGKEEKVGAAKEPGKGGGAGEAPEAVAPAAEGGGGTGGKEAKPAEVKIKRGDPGEMLTSLGEVPPSQAVMGMKSLRGVSAQEFTRQHQELAENPPTAPRPSGLPRKPAEEKEEIPEEEEEELQQCEAEPQDQTQIELETPPIQEPLPVPPWIADMLDEAPEEDFAAIAWKSLFEVPVTDESVDTNAGPRPTVDLTGEANPEEMSTQVDINRATLDAEKIKAAEEAGQDFGEHDIFPVVPEETLTAEMKAKAARRTKGQAESPKGIPADGLAAFDKAAAEQWATAIADAEADNAQAEQEKEDSETSAHNRTAKQIAALEAGTVSEQTTTQLQAQKDVNAQRLGWADELNAADTAYTKKSTDLETQARKDVDSKKIEGDTEAKKKLDDAELEAANKKRKAEEDAAKERAKAKKSSGGFFGWLKRKAKALINAIRSAVNFIFDQLRKAVKFLIDKAKKLAMWAIDKARNAIIGLIRTFGKALELAADVFLFAFPKARKKFKQYIRTGVAAAEDAVNYAADKLKEGVCAALDALGAALDFVLELYQKAYNAILDVLEFVLIKMIEILEGIARLAESASMVGDFFIGQIQEEGIGMDLTQPLPMEKVSKPGDAETTADTAIASGAVSQADGSVLQKSTLNNSDVEMSHVADLTLEPELLASLPPMREGEEYHFGYNDKPENERNYVMDEAAASATGGFTPAAPTTEGGNGTGPTSAPATPDVASMTPDEQLVYLENQPMPHTCGGQKEEEPAKNDAVPDHMRIYGPFTSGQRFSYMWGQMKKGISQWWECNKVKIIIAFAVAALITLLLAVITGGAIFAAIPPLLTIIAAILIGVAIIKAASYIKDFISLAWGGDLKGGAKALARAFAILTIELVFALLFNIGAIIKVIKSGLKATFKAAAGAAKNVVKTTVKAGRELAVAGKTIVQAGVKNSKLILQGFKNGFGEGLKTIKQLTAELLAKSRFRGFFFRLRAGYMELWGRFNPEVLLGKRKITLEDAEKGLEDIAKAGKKIAPEGRAEAEEITKAIKAAVDAGSELPKKLTQRIKKFFAQFSGQHVSSNPVLAEVWERALKKIADGKSMYAKYFENGVLKSNLSDEVMKDLYAEARSNMDSALKSVVEDLELGFKQKLKNRIEELPEMVQVHHLVYKSYDAQLAVAKQNLILALRKTGGTLDELHDLFHLISSGATANRWRTLIREMEELIRDIYKL